MTATPTPTPTPTPASGGIACPKCGCRHLPVYYTRPKADAIVRVRFCRHCGRRVITRERL